MSTGAKEQKSKSSNEMEDVLERARQTSRRQTNAASPKSEEQTASSQKFANIQANTFYKIMFQPDADPVQKMEAVAEALTYSGDKEDAKNRLEEFQSLKEFLQFERKRMAEQIISLTDTEAFSELKTVYDELNTALVDFEDKIGPLTDIVDAVYTLRTNGLTFDAFREIALEKEAEEERAELREKLEEELNGISKEVQALVEENAVLKEDKSFFGLGGTKKSAREQIAKNELKLQSLDKKLALTGEEIKKTNENLQSESELGAEFLDAKSKLRQLLDISSEEHKQRQKDLVQAATTFVSTTEQRVSSISGHFDGMDKQIGNLMDANYSMREIYAILNDATKEAHGKNESARDNLQDSAGDESELAKMNRERQKAELEDYIGSLNSSSVDTTMVLAELTNSSHRIKSMKDGNEQQITKTRQLHSSGVAGVADQLSTVLQAVSAAALGESSEMARMSLERMNNKTQDLSQKEVIRVALGAHEQNSELSKALEGLEQYGEVIRTATSITREGLTETKELLGKLEQSAREVQEDVAESISVAADVVAGEDTSEKPQQETSSESPNPFNLSRE